MSLLSCTLPIMRRWPAATYALLTCVVVAPLSLTTACADDRPLASTFDDAAACTWLNMIPTGMSVDVAGTPSELRWCGGDDKLYFQRDAAVDDAIWTVTTWATDPSTSDVYAVNGKMPDERFQLIGGLTSQEARVWAMALMETQTAHMQSLNPQDGKAKFDAVVSCIDQGGDPTTCANPLCEWALGPGQVCPSSEAYATELQDPAVLQQMADELRGILGASTQAEASQRTRALIGRIQGPSGLTLRLLVLLALAEAVDGAGTPPGGGNPGGGDPGGGDPGGNPTCHPTDSRTPDQVSWTKIRAIAAVVLLVVALLGLIPSDGTITILAGGAFVLDLITMWFSGDFATLSFLWSWYKAGGKLDPAGNLILCP